MIKRLCDIYYILQRESETELAYLFGQKLESFPHLCNVNRRFSGVFFRLLIYIRFLLMKCGLRRLPTSKKRVDYLVYAGTRNQMNSLNTILQTFKTEKIDFLAIIDPKKNNNEDWKEYYRLLKFSPVDVARAMFILLLMGKKLYVRLFEEHKPVTISCYFDVFCEPYVYLSYFLDLLKKYKPRFVITSNDHNVQNRCLLAAARYLEIKTVYIQHASVSDLFPALRFDYAFLDGQASFECYKKCEGNSPGEKADFPSPVIFLSGQKKSMSKRIEGSIRPYVGFAVNSLIEPCDEIIKVVTFLADQGVNIRLRWHPGQEQKDIDALKNQFVNCRYVSLSDPSVEDVGSFFLQCHTLIAGRSSIHLEAAIMSVKPIYFELIPQEISDYYGYVASGVAEQAADLQQLLSMVRSVVHTSQKIPNVNAVRFYSASFGTAWEGREGELVVKTLQRIAAGKTPDPLIFTDTISSGEVFKLVNIGENPIEMTCSFTNNE